MNHNVISFWLVAGMSFAGAGFAQESSGPLGVGSTVPATCSISPSGVLALPFNRNLSIDSQFYGNVNIDIVCSGGAFPQMVEFNDGLMEGFANGTKYRGMQPADVDTNNAVIFYELVASSSTGNNNYADNPNDAVVLIGLDDTTDYVNNFWSVTNTDLVMHGKIVGASDGSLLTTDTIPAGSYSDTVVMTMTFGTS